MYVQPEFRSGPGDPQPRTGEAHVTYRIVEHAQHAYARLAGLMYFLVLGFDVAGALIGSSFGGGAYSVQTAQRIMASETLYRIGLGLSLVGSLSTILLAIGLYVAVKPFDRNLAMIALLFRVVESAVGAAGIAVAFGVLQLYMGANQASPFDAHQLGALADLGRSASGAATDVSALFFSIGSTLFFFLFLRSRYLPRILSAWGIFASLVYAGVWLVSLILPHYATTTAAYGSVPILLAELSTGLWLLVKGINIPPRR
jgi:Domain of unknown function (DUF4386)